jgi:hypothetical protein
MRHIGIGFGFVLAVWVVGVAGGRAAVAQVSDAQAVVERFQEPMTPQTHLAEQPKSVGGVLRSLASRAGIVFVGQVQAIRSNGGVTEVVFAVQKPVIGEVGDTYTVREWSGRWTGGQQHYRVGQRSMIFLYAPNAAGLSSPVDGMAGVVPVIPMGANVDPLLDVRWLATHVQRAEGESITDADFGAVALADALDVLNGDGSEPPREPMKRPLPVGLRPRPVAVSVDGVPDESGRLPSILQQVGAMGASDVEH